jgi:hypothetical protein
MLDDTLITTIIFKPKFVAEGFKYKNWTSLLMLLLGSGMVLFYISELQRRLWINGNNNSADIRARIK